MIKGITRVRRSTDQEARFSILIPSWNNLEYLKLAIRAILSSSYFKHQIIVIINEGVDGSLRWIQSQEDIDYVHENAENYLSWLDNFYDDRVYHIDSYDMEPNEASGVP